MTKRRQVIQNGRRMTLQRVSYLCEHNACVIRQQERWTLLMPVIFREKTDLDP